MVPRIIEKQLLDNLKPNQVIALLGARRTGKTYLMEKIKNEIGKEKVLMVQGDDLDIAEVFSTQRLSVLRNFIKGYDYLFLDEAQKIPNIGTSLKLMVDAIPGLHIFATGSSAFELFEKVGEPLTGRSNYFYLFPFSQHELKQNYLQAKESLSGKLVFGLYPQVYLAETTLNKQDALQSIKNGYLLRDVLAVDNRKDTVFILNLLRLIAFQIGNDISYNELASTLNVNKTTVQRYLSILEKAFVIFSLPGFSRNLRKEYSKTPRYYFWDNGIRNILINNLNPVPHREDVGKLWENFCISERLKKHHYTRQLAGYYFWRTYDQQEIDLVEEKGGGLSAFEFKWNRAGKKVPAAFIKAYPQSTFTTINQENYLEFIS
jgi:predicted AAA+ superfamily ATPase